MKMISKINETGWDFLKNGTIVQSFRSVFETSFLGFWVWALLLVTIDIVILIKTRNSFLTSVVNLLLLMILYDFFPQTIFIYLLIPSILAVAGAYFINWR